MRRLLMVLALPVLLVLGGLPVSTAFAATVTGGALSDGVPATATVNNAGDDVEFTFEGTAGTHVTFDVTSTVWNTATSGGSASLVFYRPQSKSSYTSCSLYDSPTYCDFTPNATGTWRLLVNPSGTSTGSATFTFAQDQASRALTNGTKLKSSIRIAGQNASFSFKGTSGVHLSFDITSTVWNTRTSGGSASLIFYRPQSKSSYTSCSLYASPTYCDFTPNATGSWRAVLNPSGSSTGSVTLRYARDQVSRALTRGTPLTSKIAIKGQNAAFTFKAAKNRKLKLRVTSTKWRSGSSSGSASLSFYAPGSKSTYASCSLYATATACTFTPDESGTWRMLLNPSGSSVGQARFAL